MLGLGGWEACNCTCEEARLEKGGRDKNEGCTWSRFTPSNTIWGLGFLGEASWRSNSVNIRGCEGAAIAGDGPFCFEVPL